jgi:hypothetical protein
MPSKLLGLGCRIGPGADPPTFSARLAGTRWLVLTDSSKSTLPAADNASRKGLKQEAPVASPDDASAPGVLLE